ncbi:protein angel homolog 2 [Pelodytes ibericus]
MFPRRIHSLARNCIAYAEHPKARFMNRPVFMYPWWAGHHPWDIYPPFNSWFPAGNWQSPNFLGPSFQNPNWFPWNSPQSSWIHMCNYNMASQGDEPLPKRGKYADDAHLRGKLASKRSFSPTNDFRVPPGCGPSGHLLSANPGEHTRVQGKIRRWEDFSPYYVERSIAQTDRSRSPENFDFTVLSYNILSQELLEDNSHLYSHCRRPVLFWSYRLPNILKELEMMNADILCLQEVQEDHYKAQIKPWLEALGYHCEYKSRTGRKPDGCAICFKSSKFALTLAKPVEYYRQNVSLLDRDNIGLILLLRPKSKRDAPAICVANTHLLYNPKRGDIKLAQLAILLAEITGVTPPDDQRLCPIVLCGDFNSVPGSPLYQFIKEGMLNYAGLTIGKVSGQEQYPTGRRILPIPLWPESLGISQNCVYETKPTLEKTDEIPEKADEETLVPVSLTELIPIIRAESSLQHHFHLSSVYSHYGPETGIPEVTTCHSKTAVTVDYIFYSSAKDDIFIQPGNYVPCSGLKLLGRLALLSEQDLWSVNGLPNESNSSDHLSLLAKFRLET